ncbi:MAG: hypothetical protein WCK67_07950 [bacterium]
MAKKKTTLKPQICEATERKSSKIEPYEIRNAIDDISRAEQHKKNPKMMKAVKNHINAVSAIVHKQTKVKPVKQAVKKVTPKKKGK